MKTFALWLLVASGALATPDHQAWTTERYLGSNDTGYAVIRVHHDNTCNYYRDQRITYLDEYRKDEQQGDERVKSTLLVDVLHHVDANHQDPNRPAPVRAEVRARDESVGLAEILVRYDVDLGERKRPEWSERLSCSPYGQVLFDQRTRVIDRHLLEKRWGWSFDPRVEPGLVAELAVVDVAFDKGSLFLTLERREPDRPAERRVCRVDERLSEQLRDLSGLEDYYFLLGTYPSRQAANQGALEMIARCREGGRRGFRPEIWEVLPATDRLEYRVVMDFAHNLAGTRLVALEELLGRRIRPIGSRGFRERWAVDPGPAAAPQR